jgi:exopolyphosphatase / guanosine-5'-triphosphate,3'-diphosphate pyrophosphatase
VSLRRVAAVDCGTNTVKLLVADLDPDTGEERERVRTSRMVRLGQGVDETGRLSDAALDRLFSALEEYAGILTGHDVTAIRFCATSAARDASNGDVFVEGVRERLGVPPEVIGGAEEAALSYDGATRGLTDIEAPLLVVDIGGGSTELVLGNGHGDVQAGHSLDIGSVRLTERCLRGDPPGDEEVADAVRTIDAALDELPGHGVDLRSARSLVVVSGTGLTVAAAALDLPDLDRDALHRAVVGADPVRKAAARLLGMRVAARAALGYMTPGREDVIGGGALVLDRILDRTPVSTLRVSVSDILDGIAWSCVGQARR